MLAPGLVSTQANEDIIRGFQQGFAHGVQSNENELNRQAAEQARQTSENAIDARQDKAAKDTWALKSMEAATRAKAIGEMKADQARKVNNAGVIAQGETALNDLYTHAAKWTDPATRIKVSNGTDLEQMQKDVLDAKIALRGVKPNADGWLQPADVQSVVNSVKMVDPVFTPGYVKYTANKLTAQELKMQREQQLINKGSGTGSADQKAQLKATADIIKDRNNFSAAVTIAAQAHKVAYDTNYKATGAGNETLDYNKAQDAANNDPDFSKAHAGVIKAGSSFFEKLSDPRYVGPDVSGLIQAARANPKYHNLSTLADYNQWQSDISNYANTTDNAHDKELIKQTQGIISGTVTPIPPPGATSLYPDVETQDNLPQNNTNDTEDYGQ